MSVVWGEECGSYAKPPDKLDKEYFYHLSYYLVTIREKSYESRLI